MSEMRKPTDRTPSITFDEAHAAFRYEPDTGALRWRHDRCAGGGARVARAGDEAGCVDKEGYRQLCITHGEPPRQRSYRAHRVIWLMQTGRWPTVVDHINGERADNRWANLREVTMSQSNQNKAAKLSSKGKLKGVWATRYGTFGAFIKDGPKTRYLGTFKTAEAAHAAYMEAARSAFGEYACGRGRAS